jgi:hypothetical protein
MMMDMPFGIDFPNRKALEARHKLPYRCKADDQIGQAGQHGAPEDRADYVIARYTHGQKVETAKDDEGEGDKVHDAHKRLLMLPEKRRLVLPEKKTPAKKRLPFQPVPSITKL